MNVKNQKPPPPPPHNNFTALCYVWVMTLGLLGLAAYLIWSVL